jgi:hypothetical protein
VVKPVKWFAGGTRGEGGAIAEWGKDEDMQSAVNVHRPDAALRLARQGDTFPAWVNSWIIENAERQEA